MELGSGASEEKQMMSGSTQRDPLLLSDSSSPSYQTSSIESPARALTEKEHLFDKVITASDFGKQNRLVIPKHHAEKYFPLFSSTSDAERVLLKFEDNDGRSWSWGFRYCLWNKVPSYIFTKGWSHFLEQKKLVVGDILSFHRGVGELGKNRFYIDCRSGPQHYSLPCGGDSGGKDSMNLSLPCGGNTAGKDSMNLSLPCGGNSAGKDSMDLSSGRLEEAQLLFLQSRGRISTTVSDADDQTTELGAASNHKKPVRKTKWAPTTLFYSDPSNFRAMVEDLTGLKAALPATKVSKAAGLDTVTRSSHSELTGSPQYDHLLRNSDEKIDNKHCNEVQYIGPNVDKGVSNPTEWSAFHLRKRDTERERQSIGNDRLTHQGSQVHIPGSSFDCLPREGEKDRWHLKLLEKFYSSSYSILQLPGQFNEKLNEIILDVHVHPSRPLAMCFCAEILVELNLSYRNDRQLWPGRQHFVNLEVLDLNKSNLTRLPDLSESNKLRRLNLQGCKILVDVSSIQHLSKLEHLNLKGCASLRSLPSFIGLKFLSSLDLSNCLNLNRLPLSLGCLSSLAILDVRNCKRLHHIPISILRLQSLHSLDISGCLNLVKLMTGNEIGEVISTVMHSSSFHGDEFVLGSSIHSSISSENNSVELQSNWVNHDLLHVPDGGTNFKNQQQEHISAAVVSNSTPKTEEIGAVPQVEEPLLDQPVIQHRLKRSLNLLEEERSSNKVDVWGEASLKRRTSSELKFQNSQQSSATERESINRPPSMSILQVREALEGYMNMSIEDIHQADAFEDIESFVNTLIQQASNLPERAALEGLLCCVEEYKVSVPDTIFSVKTTQSHKTWLQVKLTRVGASLVQAEEQCKSLQDQLTTLSEEEEELEAEIQRLLAKKKELLDQQNSFASQQQESNGQ